MIGLRIMMILKWPTLDNRKGQIGGEPTPEKDLLEIHSKADCSPPGRHEQSSEKDEDNEENARLMEEQRVEAEIISAVRAADTRLVEQLLDCIAGTGTAFLLNNFIKQGQTPANHFHTLRHRPSRGRWVE